MSKLGIFDLDELQRKPKANIKQRKGIEIKFHGTKIKKVPVKPILSRRKYSPEEGEIIEDEVEGYELDSDIEDVTEQVLQMKEKDKVTVDLTEEMLLEEYESDSGIEDVTDQLLETRVEESVNVDLIEDDTEATIPQTNVVEDEESDERNSEDSNDLMTI